MCDRLFMQVHHRFYHIPEILNGLLNPQTTHLIKTIKERAPIHVLHNEINMPILLKDPKELNNIRVIQGIMQPNFLRELLSHLILDNLGLDYFFDSGNEPSRLVPTNKQWGTWRGRLIRTCPCPGHDPAGTRLMSCWGGGIR